MMMDGRRAVMPFGVMGGHYQPVGHVHFVTNMLDYGMDVQEALDAPRAFAFQDELRVEHGIRADVADGLAALGHNVVAASIPLGGGQAIHIDWDSGVLTGGSDPRKDGCALGY
jgi:gamma-glutamyltranspeptidase/glutathione hydrolase